MSEPDPSRLFIVRLVAKTNLFRSERARRIAYYYATFVPGEQYSEVPIP